MTSMLFVPFFAFVFGAHQYEPGGNEQAAKRFFNKALASSYISSSRMITVAKNQAYSKAVEELIEEKQAPKDIQIRQIKNLNHIVEQVQRCIKKRVRSMLGFKSFNTAISILSEVETIHRIKKEQIDLRNQSVQIQKIVIHQLFGLIA